MTYPRRVPTARILEKLDEHFARNDVAAAKRHLLYWLAEAETLGDRQGQLLLCNELMGLFRKQGDEPQATAYALRALGLTDALEIGNTVGAATTYLNAATVHKAFGRAGEALPLYARAKEIYERDLDPADQRLGGLYNNMALALVDEGRFDEAEDCYAQALAVMRKSPPEMAITYLNMASAAERQYGLEQADETIVAYLRLAAEQLDAVIDRTDGDYAFVCEKCATVFGYYGHFAYENELKERSRRIYERA